MTDDMHQNQIDISCADSIDSALMSQYYDPDTLLPVFKAVLERMQALMDEGLTLPYFDEIDREAWRARPKTVDMYITDRTEGCALNLEARGKAYATNILSYPSELPASVIDLMPTIPLGELIICHEILEQQAAEQHKTVMQHVTHLLVHGVLHLLGFDHELGQAEQDEMEGFEIEILATLNLPNPYL